MFFVCRYIYVDGFDGKCMSMYLNMWKENVVNIGMFFDVRSQKVPTSFSLLFDFCVLSSFNKTFVLDKRILHNR